MPAHAQIAHVIEENDSDFATGTLRRDEQRAHQRIRAARLVPDGGTERGEAIAESLHSLRQGPIPEVRAALDHQARGFTAGVRIDDADLAHAQGRESRAFSTMAMTAARRSPD